MDSKTFKSLFDDVAKKNDFERAFGGWFLDSSECIIVLDLQKSNFGNYFDLNIKIFIQGIFGTYVKGKDLVKKYPGAIFLRQPKYYNDLFDLETPIEEDKRLQKLEELFREFIKPFTTKALSRQGIRELEAQGKISLLPAVKAELL